MFPDGKGKAYRGQLPINSPYRDYMFEHNKTQMMWKAVGGGDRSNILNDSKLKYNEFDYVKRISLIDFSNKQGR
jgi:hypothetical protein